MKLVAAYNGTEESKTALELAKKHAKLFNARLLVISSSEGGKGEDPEEIRAVNESFAPRPDLTMILDLPAGGLWEESLRALGIDDASLLERMNTRARVRLESGGAFGAGGSGFMRMNLIWLNSPATAYNFLVLAVATLNGFGTFLLARKVTRSFWPSLLAGGIFLVSPYLLLKIELGFLQKIILFWIPLFFLEVLRFLDVLEDLDDAQAVYSNADIPDEAYED